MLGSALPDAQARTRLVCEGTFYAGQDYPCGGHLQPPCPASAEPICGGCDDGHALNPALGLCQLPGNPGVSCDATIGCAAGLLCDGNLEQCIAPGVPAGSLCSPFAPCADGLQCTTALQCSHAPFALEGETCDGILTSCADDLYCKSGFPARCAALSKPGESCNNNAQCGADGVCSFAVTQGGQIRRQCHPEFDPVFNGLTLSTEQCEAFYSAEVAASVTEGAIIRAGGGGIVALIGTSFSVGVAYGEFGKYGCFNASCIGGDTDISIKSFASSGTYNSYADIAGNSAVLIGEVQLPFSPVNFFLADVTNSVQDIGSEFGTALGAGLSPIPFAAGVYSCLTELDTVYSPQQGGQPPPTIDSIGPPASPDLGFGAVSFNGVSNRLEVVDADQLNVSNALTVEAWVRAIGTQQTVTLEAFEWHHVALAYDAAAGTVTIFKDGALAQTLSASGALGDFHPVENDFRIGGRQRDDLIDTGKFAFDGMIDEVRVWRSARTPAQIAEFYNAPLMPNEQADLAAWWRFDELVGSVAFDAQLDARHGWLGSGMSWRSPTRTSASAYADYPRSLLRPACNNAACQVDFDRDGVTDYSDNCLIEPNPAQVDADGDGYGNRCDSDFNNDCAVNVVDLGALRTAFFGSDGAYDLNVDGAVNVTDLGLFRSEFFGSPGPSAQSQSCAIF